MQQPNGLRNQPAFFSKAASGKKKKHRENRKKKKADVSSREILEPLAITGRSLCRPVAFF
jgi:hypothetical protein